MLAEPTKTEVDEALERNILKSSIKVYFKNKENKIEETEIQKIADDVIKVIIKK